MPSGNFKYEISDASAKRIVRKLTIENVGSGGMIFYPDVIAALIEENYAHPLRRIAPLIFKIEEIGHPALAIRVGMAIARELETAKEKLYDLHSAFRGIGIAFESEDKENDDA